MFETAIAIKGIFEDVILHEMMLYDGIVQEGIT